MRQGSTPALAPLLRLVAVAALALGSAAAPALAGPWSLPDEARGSRVAPLLLLSRADIREDLGCHPEMAEKVDQAIARLRRLAAATQGRTGPEAVEGRRAVDEDEKTWLETHLSEAQLERLAQVDLRWEGAAALTTRASVAGALALTDEQKAALARLVAERNAARKANPRDPLAADRAFEGKAVALLSEDQRLHWDRMIGRPIAFVAHSPSAPTSADAQPSSPGR